MINARVLERQLRELDLESVEDLRRNLAIFGEKADGFGELIGFIDHVEALAPGRLLRVVDLPQIENGSLHHMADAQTAILHHAPVAMLFAILRVGGCGCASRAVDANAAEERNA
jgi:hypothetical protein